MIDTIHIVVCMKPVEGTLAENALRHGVAGLNVGECKIAFASSGDERNAKHKNQHTRYSNPNSNIDSYSGSMPSRTDYDASGRFPANVILDGSEVAEVQKMRMMVWALLPVSSTIFKTIHRRKHERTNQR